MHCAESSNRFFLKSHPFACLGQLAAPAAFELFRVQLAHRVRGRASRFWAANVSLKPVPRHLPQTQERPQGTLENGQGSLFYAHHISRSQPDVGRGITFCLPHAGHNSALLPDGPCCTQDHYPIGKLRFSRPAMARASSRYRSWSSGRSTFPGRLTRPKHIHGPSWPPRNDNHIAIF